MIKPLMKAMCLFALMPSLSLVRFINTAHQRASLLMLRRRDLIPLMINLYESKQILSPQKDGTKVPDEYQL